MKRLIMLCFRLAILFSMLVCCQVTPSNEIPTTTPTPILSEEPVQGATPESTRPAIPTSIPLEPTKTATLWPTAPFPTHVANQAMLTRLFMFNKTTGWGIDWDGGWGGVTMASGHIMRTTDGGSTWQDVTPQQEPYRDNGSGGFFALDADTAWATFWPGEATDTPAVIWRTSDGGLTWQPVGTFCLDDEGCGGYDDERTRLILATMQFVDKNTGWMLARDEVTMGLDHYHVYQTTDGGENWALIADDGDFSEWSADLAFLDKQSGFFSSDNEARGSDWDWSIHLTRDGGVNWEWLQLPLPADLPGDIVEHLWFWSFYNIRTIPPQVVDLDLRVESEAANVYYFHYHSPDGGRTWRSWPDYENQYKENDHFVDAQTGWRLFSPDPAQPNQLQKTTDGGETWMTLKTVTWQSAQFDFVSEQIGWVIATTDGVSALLHTADGGQTWQEIKPVVAE